MGIEYHKDMIQGSDDWHQARCGLLTASEMKLVVTPTLKIASNDKERAHLYELAAQRITGYVEPSYISDDMLLGQDDESRAREEYDQHFAPVHTVGFVTNDKWGFTLGYSPDGLVGEDGQIECKSRKQKYQLETIVNGTLPDEYKIQVQTGLLVTERPWCDFISYCGGMPMFTLRVTADEVVQKAIVDAATAFHDKLSSVIMQYKTKLANAANKLIPTKRVPKDIVI